MCSALKMWLSSHCSVELVSCPAPRPWLLWYNQHCNWWNKQGTSGQGVETADMPSICVSLPSDLGDSLFPASAQTASSWPHAGLYSLGIQQVFSLMAPGDGLEWAEWEVSLPPQGHICFIRFTYWNSSHPCPRQCRRWDRQMLLQTCCCGACAMFSFLASCIYQPEQGLAIHLSFQSPSLCNLFGSSAAGEAKIEQSAKPSRT